jgi:DNA-binding Xre family transcriptional regulator
MPTHWKLEATLRRHRQSPIALVRASGLTKTTVYNIVNAKAQAIEVETLDKLVAGLEKLTGRSMSVADVIEREPERNAALEEVLKHAKPFDWEEAKHLIPDWTPQERERNEDVMHELERERLERLERQSVRDAALLETFGSSEKSRRKNA